LVFYVNGIGKIYKNDFYEKPSYPALRLSPLKEYGNFTHNLMHNQFHEGQDLTEEVDHQINVLWLIFMFKFMMEGADFLAFRYFNLYFFSYLVVANSIQLSYVLTTFR